MGGMNIPHNNLLLEGLSVFQKSPKKANPYQKPGEKGGHTSFIEGGPVCILQTGERLPIAPRKHLFGVCGSMLKRLWVLPSNKKICFAIKHTFTTHAPVDDVVSDLWNYLISILWARHRLIGTATTPTTPGQRDQKHTKNQRSFEP